MKKLLVLLLVSAFILPTMAEVKKPEVKKVCVDKKDKSGKAVKVCKSIKIHKKYKGTAIPDKKK
jgi:hypothetical protein